MAQSRFTHTFGVSKKVTNIYSWVRWITLKGLPFSYVDDILTAKFTTLEPITRQTFVSYLEKLTPLVEQKISEDMPSKFGLVTDPDLAVHIPSASEELELRKISDEFKNFHSVSRVLQAKDLNNLQSRVLFDEPGINYPELEHCLGQPASGIVHSPVFEEIYL